MSFPLPSADGSASAAVSGAAGSAPPPPTPSPVTSSAPDIESDTNSNGSHLSRLSHAPSQACSTDALGVIFSFLPLEDVAPAAAACRRWSDAIAAATVARHQITVSSMYALRSLVTSPLRRLVGELDISAITLVSGDRVESLWAAFPRLTSFTGTIDARQLIEGTALQFPSTLRILDITIAPPAGVLVWSQVDVLLSLAVRCPLTRLRVAMPEYDQDPGTPPVGAIERLLALRNTLVDLELPLKGVHGFEWGAAHFDVFRSLPHLTRLDIFWCESSFSGEWASEEELELLTADPAPARLSSVYAGDPIEHESTLRLLARLPSVRPPAVLVSGPALLPHITHVETIAMQFNEEQRSPDFPRALARCTRITDLTLRRWNGSPEEVAAAVREFLPSLVRLRSLTMEFPVDITCLSAAPHLEHTLEHITISQIRGELMRSLLHLRSLRRLRSVDLSVCPEPVGLMEFAEDDRGTIFLPSLESLRMTLRGGPSWSDRIDVGRFFGHLPSLRTLKVAVYAPQWRLMPWLSLTQLTGLTDLNLNTHATSESVDLAPVVSSMPHLRDLLLHGHHTDLSFLSSSAGLAHSLVSLTLFCSSRPMHACQLRHLRSLGSLQYLKLIIQFARPLSDADASECDESSALASASPARESDVICPSRSSQSVLASLRDLFVFYHLEETATESDRRRRGVQLDQLGPMTQLRTAEISTVTTVVHQPQGILDALAHSTRLTQLTLKIATLTDALLTSLLRPMTLLRELEVTSGAFGGLSFLSASHLADTMEMLNLRIYNFHHESHPAPLPTSELRYLRALRQLRSLELALFVDRNDEPIDEYEIDHPHFPRHTWPLLHDSEVKLK